MSNIISADMVRNLREKNNLTQEGLAEKSTLGIATIKRIESSGGEYRCRFRAIEKLAEAFNVDVMLLSVQRKYDGVSDKFFSPENNEAHSRQSVKSAIERCSQLDWGGHFITANSSAQGSEHEFQNVHFTFAA